MVVVTLIIALVLAIFITIFAIENTQPTTIVFFGQTLIDGSISLVLVISYLMGVLTAFILLLPGMIKNRAQIALQKRKISGLEKSTSGDQKPAG